MPTKSMFAFDRKLKPGYNNSFDFSLTFESAILTIAPLGVLIAACPFHIWHYRKRPAVAKIGMHFWLLTIAAIALFCLEVAKAVVWRMALGDGFAISQAATALSAVGAAAVLLINTLEYRHSPHSSYISSATLSVAFCVDIVKTRSFFMRNGMSTIAALSAATAVPKLAIIMLHEFPKPLCDSTGHILSQEATCGFWNQTLAVWVNPTMGLGPAVFSHMLTTACEWAQAFSIQTTVASMGQEEPRWRPTSLILATVAIYLMKMTTISMTTYYINKTSTLTRGLLVTQITKKNFALTLVSAQKTEAVTLMSTDVEQICDLIIELHEFATAIPAVACCLYFIYRMVGVAFVLTFAIALAVLMTKPAAKAQKRWVEGIQERVAQMSIVLPQLKGIKMLGLQSTITLFMQRSREAEIKRSLRIRHLRMISQANHSIETVWTMTAGFVGGVFWTTWKGGLDASSLYTYLSLAALFQGPLRALILNSPMLGGCYSNFLRIQEFILQSEREDPRQLFNRIGAISLDVDEREVAANSSDILEKKPLASETVQISINNLAVAALATENHANVLDSVSFDIAIASLNIIIGPVGCGKSTLLRTLLGETALSSGTISIRTDNMAFCHQSAWIPNCTIRQAVVGANEYDHEWYQEVLKASALDYDIGKITDQAKTGNDNGGLLSGGQKQRVALARAIYSRAPVLILDDILSALDRSTAKLIFCRLLAPDGLLKRQGRTVVLATHSVEWLSDADQLLVLDSSGHISSHVDKNDIAAVQTATLTSQNRDKDQDFEEDVVLNLDDESDMDEEKIDTMLANDKTLYKLLFGTVPRYLLIVVATSAVAWQVLSTWNELWARIWLSIGPMDKLLVVPLLIGVFVHVVNSAFMVWVWQIVTMPKIANRMHKLFLDAVMTATLPFLSGSRSGALLNRFSQDMTLFAFKLPHGVFRVFLSLTIVIIQCVYLISGSYYMVAFIPLLFGILWVLQNFYLQTSRQIRILDLETKTPLFATISETAAGVEHIRAYGWQGPLLSQTYEMLDHSQKSFYYMYAIQRWLVVILNAIATATVSGLVSIALLVVNASSQGGLGLALMAVIYLQADLNFLITEWTTLETSLGAVARLQSFMKDTPTEKDEDCVTEQTVTWPSRGEIEFKNVSASYSPEADARRAINDVSFQIKSGESAALVGRTGSGKSSIILTLLNFLRHTGTITIDGVDISNIPREQLRQSITTIPQDHVDIPGTVRDNLLPLEIMNDDEDKKQDDAVLIRILKTVGLWDHISRHGGLHEPLTKIGLSAGQRQLLSLARALMHHANTGSKIVIMDEATSNMDYQTDTIMHRVMETKFENCTRVVVTHRYTVLSQCDVLFRLEDGKVVSQERQSRVNSARADLTSEEVFRE
ncbi:hypothetical protein N7526_001852 [Penicillium atrosanguineum]|nr:hypothetical protein N7526_001852 [Penicillium atrosanguineum]